MGPDVVDPAVDQPSRVPGWGQGRMPVSGQITVGWAESACPLQGSHVRLGGNVQTQAHQAVPGGSAVMTSRSRASRVPDDAELVLAGSCPIADACRTAPRLLGMIIINKLLCRA